MVFLIIPTASVSVISISRGVRNCWMYFPVTSLCSVGGGSGVGKSQALGIKALTESRLASPNSFQFAIVLSVSRVSNSRSGLNIPDQMCYLCLCRLTLELRMGSDTSYRYRGGVIDREGMRNSADGVPLSKVGCCQNRSSREGEELAEQYIYSRI